MNRERVILSICIPLHNRSEVVIGQIEDILKVDSTEYDIIVLDSSDAGRDLLSVWGSRNDKVKVFRESPNTPAMKNWKLALDYADGIFAFHLNDRDTVVTEKLLDFIEFLKKHPKYNGGICKYISTNTEPILCTSSMQALMNVPYFAIHPTGVVLNIDSYHKVKGLDDIFSRQYGTHPHDAVLGRLSEKGNLFIYTDEIWRMATPEFYKKNKSGFEINKKEKFFFAPQARLYECKIFMKELNGLKVPEKNKIEKQKQMIRNYLHLATTGYFYVLESEAETAHYGIKVQKLNVIQKYKMSQKIFRLFSKNFIIDDKEGQKLKRWLAVDMMIPILATYTSKINNKAFRTMLRKLRVSRDKKDNAVLR